MMTKKYTVFIATITICQMAYCEGEQTVGCEVEVTGGAALIEINKFPAAKIDNSDDSRTCNSRINHLIFNGTNELRVIFNPSINPATNGVRQGYSLNVLKMERAGTNVLCELLVGITNSVATTNVSFVIHPWPLLQQDLPWLARSPIVPADDDKNLILSLVTQVKNAFVAKDKNALKVLYTKRNNIMAISQGKNISEIEQEQSSFYDIAFTGQTCTVLPVDLTSLVFRPSTNASLVSVVSTNGADPIIVDLGDDTTLEVPIVVSKDADNAWILVQ